MDLRDDKVNEDQQDPPAAQETKETLEKMDRRVLMVHLVLLEPQARGASWDSLGREENVGCRVCLVQGVHQGNRDLQALPETRALQVQWGLLGPTDLVVIPVPMALQDLTVPQAKLASWDRGATEETLVLRAWLDLRDFLDLQVLLVLQDLLEDEETLAPEGLWDRQDQLERGD